MRVFHHDIASGYFPDKKEAINYNEDDPDADLYSILDQMEEYRKDGVFHIRQCYPTLSSFDPPCNEWTQSSNFAVEEEISDFTPITINWRDLYSWSPGDFNGLKKARESWSYYFASSTYWWFSIGFRYTWWGGIPQNYPTYVPVVEVYLAVGMNTIYKTNFICNSITYRGRVSQQNPNFE